MTRALDRRVTDARRRLERIWASDAGRLVLLTLYYLAIIGGALLAHLDPDHRPMTFIYQAF